MTYAEKLRNPLWQKKRLQVLNRDKWACRCCRDTSKELHVHHKKYIRGRNPWESPMDDLETLCRSCHAFITLYEKTNLSYFVLAMSHIWHVAPDEKKRYYIVTALHKQCKEYFIDHCFLSEDETSFSSHLLMIESDILPFLETINTHKKNG
jgi:hypothetical protein